VTNSIPGLMSLSTEGAKATVQTSPSGMVLVGKSGKKICCACPITKKERDECMVLNGQDVCSEKIEAHKRCLREDGFQVD